MSSKDKKMNQKNVSGALTTTTNGSNSNALALSRKPASTPTSEVVKFQASLRNATQLFVITEKAKDDILQRQVQDFNRILCKKISKQFDEFRRQQDILEASMKDTSGSPVSSPSSSSDASTAILSSIGNQSSYLSLITSLMKPVDFRSSAGLFNMIASIMVLSKTGVKGFVFIVACLSASKIANLTLMKTQHSNYSNFISAFSEKGPGDARKNDVELDKTIESVARTISIRYMYQISRLTKASQEALADVIVSRISRSLTRHPETYVFESRSPLVADMQHRFVSLRLKVDRLTKPGDSIRFPRRLPLIERCLRAITVELDDSDHKVLELDPYFIESRTIPLDLEEVFHEDSHDHSQDGPWIASELLTRCGIHVPNNGTSDGNVNRTSAECYWIKPKISLPKKYGFCVGTESEAKQREMVRVSSFISSPLPESEEPEFEQTPPQSQSQASQASQQQQYKTQPSNNTATKKEYEQSAKDQRMNEIRKVTWMELFSKL